MEFRLLYSKIRILRRKEHGFVQQVRSFTRNKVETLPACTTDEEKNRKNGVALLRGAVLAQLQRRE